MKKEFRMHQTALLWMVAIVSSIAMTCALAGCGGSAAQPAAPAAEEQENASTDESEEKDQKKEEKEQSEESEVEKEPEPEEETPAAIPVELGETYSTDDYDIVFEEAYWDAADEEGYWKYYDTGSFSSKLGGFSANAPIFIVRTKITNKYTSTIKPTSYSQGTALANGKYEYEVSVKEAESGGYEIAPLETRELYVYVALPEAMKDQFENIKIDWGFDPKAEHLPLEEGAYDVYELYFEE